MQQIFQIGVDSVYRLQNEKLLIVKNLIDSQTLIIFDSSILQFKEYHLLNFKITKFFSDSNLTNLVLFQEIEKKTKFIIVNLEKSFNPVYFQELDLIGLIDVYWININIFFMAFKNSLLKFDIQKKQLSKEINIDNIQFQQFKIDYKFQFIIFEQQLPKKTLIRNINNPSEYLLIENSSFDLIENETEVQILVIEKNNNQIIFHSIILEDNKIIQQQYIQNQLSGDQFQDIISLKFRKEKKDILLLDSNGILFVMNLSDNYQLNTKQKFEQINQYGISIDKQSLILINKKLDFLIEDNEELLLLTFDDKKQQSFELSHQSKTKFRALQGLISSQSHFNIESIKKQYQNDYQTLNIQFDSICKMSKKFQQLPLVEYRIIQLPKSVDNSQYIPNMKDYVLTKNVAEHLQLLEFALKGDNPIICEGASASGKTSIIQYLAYINNQPLIVMNLNSFTQINDFIGKIEILQGFNLQFQPGPFALAVQNGFWILLDEANLAPDYILRIIEDVLEFGFLTIYGNSINSHIDLVDGCLNIRKHQNFKLFLAQNPATDINFSATRNIFSPSLLSQFLSIKFSAMSNSDIQQIISLQIQQRLRNLNLEVQQYLIFQLMELYQQIKADDLDNGLFTLRDILQIIDTLSLQYCNKEENKLIHKLLPLNFCLKVISTQFIKQEKKKEINQQVEEFRNFGYTDYEFLNRKQERDEYYNKLESNRIYYLSCYEYLFPILTLCYQTKRPAHIVGDQYCGKLESILFWAKSQGIRNRDCKVCELSENTTFEDLFGKYQPDDVGFKWVSGPVTDCFSQGRLLILKNLESPDSALIESLNGILEKNYNSLFVQNQKYKRHPDFAIIAISSDFEKSEKKFTPALKSRFLTIKWRFGVNKKDVTHLLNQLQFQNSVEVCQFIFQNLEVNNFYIQFNKILRFLRPIQQYISYLQQQYQYGSYYYSQQTYYRNIGDQVEQSFKYFLALSKQDIAILSQNQLSLPIQFYQISYYSQVEKDFTFTNSRKILADILAIAIVSKIPIVLQGTAGVGKTKLLQTIQENCKLFANCDFYYFNMNQNTDQNDLMGQYLTSFSQKDTFEFKKGPLYLGMEKGGIVLIDEANLSDQSIMNFLAQVAKYPVEFYDTISGNTIKVNDKFRIFFAQNPPHFVGRSQLTDSLLSKCVVIDVPNYYLEEVLSICKGFNNNITQSMNYFIKEIIKYPYNGDEKKLIKNNISFTLRQFLKFKNRIQKQQFSCNDSNWKKLVKLHQQILFPLNEVEYKELQGIIQIDESKENSWIFIICNENYRMQTEIKLKQSRQFYQKHIQKEVNNLSPEATLVLCKIAYCFYYQENVLLEGPTTYKFHLVSLFSKMIDFNVIQPLETIYITNATEIQDLIGGIESHNHESYLRYCQGILEKLKIQKFDNLNEKSVKDHFSKLQKEFQNQQQFFNGIINNYGNKFPFVERGIPFNYRFGGIIYLKNINLADQSVLEGLNSLLEEKRNFIVNGKKIINSNEFFIIASTNQASGGCLSEALKSRFTKIVIEEQLLLNSKNELQSTFINYIQQKSKSGDKQNKIIEFITKFLTTFKSKKPINFKNLTYKSFYQWISFLDWDLKNATEIEKLSLGTQYVLLDPIKLQFSDILMDEKVLAIFNKARQLLYQEIKSQIGSNSKLVLNLQSNEIISRIFAAFNTKYIPCLIGPPGVGKSALTQEIAKIFKKQFCRICCSDNLNIEDLFGSYAPQQNKSGLTFTFQEGYLAKALKDNSVILFDEVNLTSQEVLSTLQSLFNYNEKSLRVRDFNIKKENCVFICAMNPSTFQGRSELPFCIQNQISNYYIKQFDLDQTIDIFKQSYSEQINTIQKQKIDIKLIFQLHKESQQISENFFLDKKNSLANDFNIRYLQNLFALFNNQFLQLFGVIKDEQVKTELIIVCLEIIYCNPFEHKVLRDLLLKNILQKYQISIEQWNSRKIFIAQIGQNILFQRYQNNKFTVYLTLKKFSRIITQISFNYFYMNFKNSIILEKLIISILSTRIILCQGDYCTGKTTTVLKLASLMNQKCLLIPIHNDLEIDDLLGNFSLINQNNEIIDEYLISLLNNKKDKQQQYEKQKSPKMKYFEGILKICIKQGYWLILDNINQAKTEIIERLNSLGEDDPLLFINEFGDDNRVLKPHPQFRLICIQNQYRANTFQLSPAFYNRCIKINFEVNLQEEYVDFVEILTRQSEEQQLYQKDNALLASRLLNQVLYMQEQKQLKSNFRAISRAYELILGNEFCQYDRIMQLVFGDYYISSSQESEFPTFNISQSINQDEILKKLISNTLSQINQKKEDELRNTNNLFSFFQQNILSNQLDKLKCLQNNFLEKIEIIGFKNTFEMQLGGYTFNINGNVCFKISSIYNISFIPSLITLQIKQKKIDSFLMKGQCNFLNETFYSEIKGNWKQDYILELSKKQDQSSPKIFNQLQFDSCTKNQQQVFEVFKDFYQNASFKCIFNLINANSIFLNYQLYEYQFEFCNFCKLKKVNSTIIIKENEISDFFINFQLNILDCYIGDIQCLQTTSLEFDVTSTFSYYLFNSTQWEPFYQAVGKNLKQCKFNRSLIDLQNRELKIHFMTQETIAIPKFTFCQIEFKKILFQTKLNYQLQLQSLVVGDFLIFQKKICTIKADSSNIKTDKLQFTLEQSNCQDTLKEALNQLLEKYRFNQWFLNQVKQLSQITLTSNIIKIDDSNQWTVVMNFNLNIQLLQAKERQILLKNILISFNSYYKACSFVEFDIIYQGISFLGRTELDDYAKINSKIQLIKMIKQYSVENFLEQLGLIEINELLLKKTFNYKQLLLHQEFSLSKINDNKNQIKFKDDQLDFTLEIIIQNDWNINEYLCLKNLKLILQNINNQEDLYIQGDIYLIENELQQIQLSLNNMEEIKFIVSGQNINKVIDPITLGLSSLGISKEFYEIMPKLDYIKQFNYNFEQCYLNCELIRKDYLYSKNLAYYIKFQNPSFILKDKVVMFQIGIQILKSVFMLQLTFNDQSDFKSQIILNSTLISQFDLVSYLKEIMNVKFYLKHDTFFFRNQSFQLLIQSHSYNPQINFKDGIWQIFDELIQIEQLEGKIIISSQERTYDPQIHLGNFKGYCILANNLLGETQFEIRQDIRELNMDIITNDNFDLLEYTQVFEKSYNPNLQVALKEIKLVFKDEQITFISKIECKDILLNENMTIQDLKIVSKISKQAKQSNKVEKLCVMQFKIIPFKIKYFELEFTENHGRFEQKKFCDNISFDVMINFSRTILKQKIEDISIFNSVILNSILELNLDSMFDIKNVSFIGTYYYPINQNQAQKPFICPEYVEVGFQNEQFILKGRITLAQIYSIQFKYQDDQLTFKSLEYQQDPLNILLNQIYQNQSYSIFPFLNQNIYIQKVEICEKYQNLKISVKQKVQNKILQLNMNYREKQILLSCIMFQNCQFSEIIQDFGLLDEIIKIHYGKFLLMVSQQNKFNLKFLNIDDQVEGLYKVFQDQAIEQANTKKTIGNVFQLELEIELLGQFWKNLGVNNTKISHLMFYLDINDNNNLNLKSNQFQIIDQNQSHKFQIFGLMDLNPQLNKLQMHADIAFNQNTFIGDIIFNNNNISGKMKANYIDQHLKELKIHLVEQEIYLSGIVNKSLIATTQIFKLKESTFESYVQLCFFSYKMCGLWLQVINASLFESLTQLNITLPYKLELKNLLPLTKSFNIVFGKIVNNMLNFTQNFHSPFFNNEIENQFALAEDYETQSEEFLNSLIFIQTQKESSICRWAILNNKKQQGILLQSYQFFNIPSINIEFILLFNQNVSDKFYLKGKAIIKLFNLEINADVELHDDQYQIQVTNLIVENCTFMLQSTIKSGLVEQVEIYLSYDCKSSEKLQNQPFLWMIPLANVSIYSFTIFKSTIVVQFNLEFLCLNQTLEIVQEIQCYDTQIIELINNLNDKLLTYLKMFEELNFEKNKIDNYFEYIKNNKETIMEYFQTQFQKDVSNQLRIKKNINELIQTENFQTLTFNCVVYQKNKSQLLNCLIETEFIDQIQNINLENYITQDSSKNIDNPQREQNLSDQNQITQKVDDEITEVKQTHPNKTSQGNQQNQEEKETNYEENTQLDLDQKNDFHIQNELNQILQTFLNQQDNQNYLNNHSHTLNSECNQKQSDQQSPKQLDQNLITRQNESQNQSKTVSNVLKNYDNTPDYHDNFTPNQPEMKNIQDSEQISQQNEVQNYTNESKQPFEQISQQNGVPNYTNESNQPFGQSTQKQPHQNIQQNQGEDIQGNINANKQLIENPQIIEPKISSNMDTETKTPEQSEVIDEEQNNQDQSKFIYANQNVQESNLTLKQKEIDNINLDYVPSLDSNLKFKKSIKFTQNEVQSYQKQLDEDSVSQKNYRALFKKADQDLKNFWMLFSQHKVNCMKGKIIVLDIIQKAEDIISFGEILIALTFLKQKFEIIFSGSYKPILLKDENSYINEDELQKILHAVGGYQNSSFPFYNNYGRQQYNYIILFDFKNKMLELSQKCKSELYQEGILSQVYFYQDSSFVDVYINQSKCQDIYNLMNRISSNNHKEILNTISNSNEFTTDEDDRISISEIVNQYEQEIIKSKNLEHLLDVSKFTKYSLSSKGTILDIKGIIKFLCTNGTSKDIMKKKNKGGKHFYLVQLIVDLSNMQDDIIYQLLLPSIYCIIEIMKEMKIVCNLLIIQGQLEIKSDFSLSWSEDRLKQLYKQIQRWKNNSNSQLDSQILDKSLKLMDQYNSNNRFLVFINHSFYNYQSASFQSWITLAQSKHIRIFSLGINETKYLNTSIEKITHFPLESVIQIFGFVKNMFEKKNEEIQFQDQPFKFTLNDIYQEKLQLELYSNSESQFNVYLNKVFNFNLKSDTTQDVDQAQNIKKHQGLLKEEIEFMKNLNLLPLLDNMVLHLIRQVKNQK